MITTKRGQQRWQYKISCSQIVFTISNNHYLQRATKMAIQKSCSQIVFTILNNCNKISLTHRNACKYHVINVNVHLTLVIIWNRPDIPITPILLGPVLIYKPSSFISHFTSVVLLSLSTWKKKI